MIKTISAAVRNVARGMMRVAPVRLWAMIFAGPALTAYSVGVVLIVWKGPWSQGMEHDRLEILGWSLLCLHGLLAIIMVSLASVSVKASGPGGFAFEADGDGSQDTPDIYGDQAPANPREGQAS